MPDVINGVVLAVDRFKVNNRLCAQVDCASSTICIGLCDTHFHQLVTLSDYGFELPEGYCYLIGSGYVFIRAPGHPEANPSGWAREHRKVWHDEHGPIPAGYVVHHIDSNRTNNAPGNLQALSTTEHGRAHRRYGVIA